jgi:CRISPR/Cas system CSM-associated protein Csm3 (group 7 of RAMP superfamily)
VSQNIATRHEVRGVITCRSAVHVGGWNPSAVADLAVARDGLGLPFVPGTSIAGALRGYLHGTTRFRDHLDDLFGHIEAKTQNGSPSWVRVDDAHLVAAGGALVAVGASGTEPVVRDGVGIDRRTVSAAAGILYGREVLPAGTRFAFRLVTDTPANGPTTRYPGGWDALVADATAAVVDGLRSGRVPLGAARTRGLGRVTLDDAETRVVDLSRREGLVGWLRGGTWRPPAAPTEAASGDGMLAITIAWRPVSPVLVKDSLEGTVVDALPLTEVNADGTVRLLLPGSSVKGVLRAHAERIVRTLRRQDAPTGFAEALADPPSGVDVLFGMAPTGREDNVRRPAEAGLRGALAVADCYSEGSVTATQWNAVLAAHPEPTASRGPGEKREERAETNKHRGDRRSALREELEEMNGSFVLGVSDHVAIDRWTGGAADHRLFSVLDPAAGTAWDPIRLTLDVGRLTRASTRPGSSALALPLLLLVLRDLTDGWLSLGYGGTRGRGQIEVTEIGFAGKGLGAGWQAVAGSTLGQILADPPPDVLAAMDAWAKEFTDQEVPV